MNTEVIKEWVLAFMARPDVVFLVSHICLNTIVAVATALKEEAFDLRRLADFLRHKLGPYLLVYAGAVGFSQNAGVPLTIPVLGLITLTLAGDLIDNLGRLGIRIPNWLSQLVSTDPIR
jgi:hypothetical protein